MKRDTAQPTTWRAMVKRFKALETLKVQINENGAWRTQFEFSPALLATVKKMVIARARKHRGRATWRISENSRHAIAYLEGPGFRWRKA